MTTEPFLNKNHYSTFSTATLVKLLNRAAGDSAEHRAIQNALGSREIEKRLQQDKMTPQLPAIPSKPMAPTTVHTTKESF